MPTVDPDRRPDEEFDPEKTLFFTRRKQPVSFLPLAVVCALVLGSGVLIVWAFTRQDEKPVGREAKVAAEKPRQNDGKLLAPDEARDLANPPKVLRGDAARATPVPFDGTKPVRAALPVGAAELAAPAEGEALPPPTPDPALPPNLDVNDPGNAQVRADVLRRIDLMPNVSAANKDKLYASVDHARGMGRLITVPFVRGENTLRAVDMERLKAQLASPQMRQTLEDPTVVFVILGYADPKGSDKINAEISLARARAVLDALRDRCGILNVMHAVAMGGSTLFSTQQAEKNRVVEVWAVLP